MSNSTCWTAARNDWNEREMTTAMRPEATTPQTPTTRHFVALRLAIEGDLRFLSHHDELRLLSRALLRAEWPLAWSEGFNPIPRITAPLPRGLGVASLADLFVIELAESWPAERLFDSLAVALPQQCRLMRVDAGVAPKGLSARRVGYSITLEERPAELSTRIAAFLNERRVIAQRDFGPKKQPRPIDIRGFVEELTETDDGLWLTTNFDGQQSARPSEILDAIGMAGHDAVATRERIEWTNEPEGRDTWPPTERTMS
ncbi:MAG: TIGR03936 family radical SAM-associated protein [Phycisphaerales bacterium]|nr:TIGR03936 family radical SAM-associated protein [Phycisphaerales bacterium]